MSSQKLNGARWEVAVGEQEVIPNDGWIPAEVPGAVQLDWARAQGWGSWFEGGNFQDYEWMEDRFWIYRVKLPREISNGRRLVFRCDGIDYQYEILLGDHPVLAQEGMQRPICVDVSEYLGRTEWLHIRVHPVPKDRRHDRGEKQSNKQPINSCKPAVNYGWDFSPRLIPLGIWREAWFEEVPERYLISSDISYTLSDDFKTATVRSENYFGGEVGQSASGILRWQLISPDGQILFTHRAEPSETGNDVILEEQVSDPQLWWPHDQGAQPLYTSLVEWISPGEQEAVQQRVEKKIGFRRVRLVKYEGGWGDRPPPFPVEADPPATTLEINGRAVFGKGSNLVPPSAFLGSVTRDDYARLLELARGAHMNLLRLWGGGPALQDDFYELCDELGIMVWQEFPLACMRHEDHPPYLDVLDADSRAMIRRLRPHPCVVLWCGGNELYNCWSRMDRQSHALRLLNSNCFELDRQTPFLDTSPLHGMGHGPYTLVDPPSGREIWQCIAESDFSAYTEFGMPSPAPVEVLKTFMPEENLWPVDGMVWYWHKAFGQWITREAWLFRDFIEGCFGEAQNLEELVERGQLLQGEIYKGIFEEVRRRQPKTGLVTNWCLNEPWPTAANNSLVSWPAVPKASLKEVGQALRPVLVSARVAKFRWSVGDTFEAELWRLTDLWEPLQGTRVDATLKVAGQTLDLGSWNVHEGAPNRNQQGPTVRAILPDCQDRRFTLELAVEAFPEWSSTYVFSLQNEK